MKLFNDYKGLEIYFEDRNPENKCGCIKNSVSLNAHDKE